MTCPHYTPYSRILLKTNQVSTQYRFATTEVLNKLISLRDQNVDYWKSSSNYCPNWRRFNRSCTGTPMPKLRQITTAQRSQKWVKLACQETFCFNEANYCSIRENETYRKDKEYSDPHITSPYFSMTRKLPSRSKLGNVGDAHCDQKRRKRRLF